MNDLDFSILRILAEASGPLSGSQLALLLNQRSYNVSERTIRLYLQRLDQRGYTESQGKQGRLITEQGKNLVDSKRLIHKLGFMSAKIDRMTYTMSFDLALRRGTVVVNVAVVERQAFLDHVDDVITVFDKGYAMGTLVGLLKPGASLGSLIIPPNHVGFCTVCSVTLNGVLLKHGIPTRSLFSGLLELDAGVATRFVELISYDGTTVDPLQLFIRGRMTDYLGAIRTGFGRIGAGFREIPEESFNLARNLADKLKTVGLGAFLSIGEPSKEVLNVPVREGCCGVVVIGGLNPVAIFEETGVTVQQYALAGYMEYNELFNYSELRSRLRTP